VGVAQDHRAPGADVIDVFLAFGVIYIGSGGPADKYRVTAHALEGANRGIDPAGDVVLCGLKLV